LLLLLGVVLASGEKYPPFSKTYLGCAEGENSGPNCAKSWEFSGGEGYGGQRPNYQTKIHCSPSCTDASNPKICSLILALHGFNMTPDQMEWAMLRGITSGGDAFSETPANGGPFCISIHKAYTNYWSPTCKDGSPDSEHLYGFINWALKNFPIDPNAVNLHGYSNGAYMINSLMFTGCKVEPLIAAVAPYAGGGKVVPTTKAAYLIPHGTHDNIVPFREDWTGEQAVPSCECNGLNGQPSCFDDDNKLRLYGMTLAAGIAQLRGYEGDIFTSYPTITSTFHFVQDSKCKDKYNACINPKASPNPWNANFDCNSLPTKETDSIVFPITDNAGPVVIWKMNLHNHNYPDVQRMGTYGPTEFFFQIRKFFYANRRRYPRLTRTVEEESTDQYCTDPIDDGVTSPPVTFFQKYIIEAENSLTPMTKERCKQLCQDDDRCSDAFYFHYKNYYPPYCKIHFDLYPCISTSYRYNADAVHYKAGNVQPTLQPILQSTQPISQPILQPISQPTSSPVGAPSLCISSDNQLISCALAGYSCVGNSGDSNDGTTTQQGCEARGGNWTPYSCTTANSYYLSQSEELQSFLAVWWRGKCCTAPTPDPPDGKMCYDLNTQLDNEKVAGYNCFKGETTIGDSNDFTTTEQSCVLDGGTWIMYSCKSALDFYNSYSSNPGAQELLLCYWAPTCCIPKKPAPSPVPVPTKIPTLEPTASPIVNPPTFKNCDVTKCSVPTCVWSGKDGPGWDPLWTGDTDGKRTKSGFCTDYCKVYNDDDGKALCGTSSWHQSGTNCSGCAGLASNPTIPKEDQKPSSGLCADTETLSSHVLWGSGMIECGAGTGPAPTTEFRCTVYQAFNGDSILNPGRTCDDFCSSSGLKCKNGYDDVGDGCSFGGPGIGCNNILGTGSVGGPTPDHVCVCVRSNIPTMLPTPLPMKSLTPTLTASPTKSPSTDTAYCTRDNPSCWPTAKELNNLDAQLRGKVTNIPADGSSYDVCYAQGNDAFKLTEVGNGVCYQYHDCKYEFCRAEFEDPDLQLPGVIIEAFGADDVSKALKFASDHAMAVTIKTSGHSFMGSSTGKDTLNIVTTQFDENDETELLSPYTWSNSCPGSSPVQHVLRAGGGVMWKQAYLAAGFNVHVVGGGGLSVSAAGGWLQGCGLSAMSPTHGLGVDNVLAFDVVLADGSLVVADDCSHSDLFWALRGGGGGTFGVVTKMHYRVHSNPNKTKFVACRVNIETDNGGVDTMRDAWIDFIVEKSASGIDRRWGGYWSLEGSVTFWFRGSMNDAKVTLINDIEDVKRSLPAGLKPSFGIEYEEHSSYLKYRGGNYPDFMPTDKTGFENFYIGSWLIAKSDIESDSGRTVAKNMLKKVAQTQGVMFNYLLGGAVNDIASDATAVHPVMRKAVWQLEVFRPIHMNLLMETFPNGAAGFNHHSKDLPDWKNNLWGSNYPRLESIKATYDPNSLFNCYHCVGYSGKEPFQQAGVSSDTKDRFRLISSVRVTDSSGNNVVGMKVGILEGPALGLNGPRFISDGPYDWKPMYSPGNTMVTFFRTFNSNFEKDTVIKVLKAEEGGEDVGTISTSGRNYNPTWIRSDFDLPDAEKRVIWVRYENWVDTSIGNQMRAAAYFNCASCKGSQQRMLSSEAVMNAARASKYAEVLKETNNIYHVYDVGEWPMTSLHDGRVLILRQFVAINYPTNNLFKRWSQLYLLTVPPDGSSTIASDYQVVEVPLSWDDGWVHKIYFSAGENYVTYQRNGNKGKDNAQSSLCLAQFQTNIQGSDVLASVTNENCFVQNNPSNGVTDWYARMTHDERHIIFSSNRPSSLKANIGYLAYEPFRLYAYVISSGDIVQLTPTYSFKNYWYPSTHGLTTFSDLTSLPSMPSPPSLPPATPIPSVPTKSPVVTASLSPTSSPTLPPIRSNSLSPSLVPSSTPSSQMSEIPSSTKSKNPSSIPSRASDSPSSQMSENPSSSKSKNPSSLPSNTSDSPSLPPSDLSVSVFPSINPCVGLKKNRCLKESQCIYGTKRFKRMCGAKQTDYENDCFQTTSKLLCKAKDWCKYKSKICTHKCDGLKKKLCKKEKNESSKKICKYGKKEHPCFKCHPTTKCMQGIVSLRKYNVVRL